MTEASHQEGQRLVQLGLHSCVDRLLHAAAELMLVDVLLQVAKHACSILHR